MIYGFPQTKADATGVHPRAPDVGQEAENRCAIKAGLYAAGLTLDVFGVGEEYEAAKAYRDASRLVAAHNRFRSVKKLAAAKSALRHLVLKDAAENAALELGGDVATGDNSFTVSDVVLDAFPIVSQIRGGEDVRQVCWHPNGY